jgi:hypothetical protein
MICYATDLQSGHPGFTRDTTEVGEDPFADRFAEKRLTILRAMRRPSLLIIPGR